MQRRSLIRILGGGSIAAALPLAGCSTELPAQATLAWSGPGGETEPRRWALAHALLAPNPHNLQSWAVDLAQRQQIVLWVDATRLLPQTDPQGRQVMIGLGAFLELLRMALAQQGWQAQVALFPEGEPAGLAELPRRPVARITLVPGGQADPLFAQVFRRRTPKLLFDTARTPGMDSLLALGAAADRAPVQFGAVLEAEPVQALRELCLRAAMVEFDTERTVMESIRLTRVGPDEIARHRDGISVNSAMARFAASVGLFDREAVPAPGSVARNKMNSAYEGYCRSAMGFVWLFTPGNSRRLQLQAGAAFVRMQLQAVVAGLGVHPLSQALQEFDEMRPAYEQAHQLLLGQPAPRTPDEPHVQMLCRVGHPLSSAAPSPRRPLNAILR